MLRMYFLMHLLECECQLMEMAQVDASQLPC